MSPEGGASLHSLRSPDCPRRIPGPVPAAAPSGWMQPLPMNQAPMLRLLPLLIVLTSPLVTGPGAAEPLFPKPPELSYRVDFWRRVYTEVDQDHGFIHDSKDLRLVYETASVPQKLSRHGSRNRIKARRNHIDGILARLAAGKRTGLTAEEARVLALFPPNVTNRALREARSRIRFQRGQADKFRAGLIRQGRWEDYMRQVFRDRRLPEALVALPHVESSFNPKARSHVGASGLWQFTRSTGRLYMRVDHIVDERNDPFLATIAAARLLRANHDRLGTWPLALTAYNHGVGGMSRAVRKLGTDDIVTVLDRYKSRTFGFASRNFYCEFVAAHEIQQDPARYFGALPKDDPEQPEIAVLQHYVKVADLSRLFGVSPEALRDANLALQSPVWSGQKFVPKGYALRVPRDPMRPSPEIVLASLPADQRHPRQVPDRTYRVRRGDTLSRIARNHGTRESTLVALNGLRSRHRIRVGQVLKLPVRGGIAHAATSAPSSAVRPADGRYRVQRGDTLSGIARRFRISEQALLQENGLRNRNHLQVGQVLELPAVGTTVMASNDAAPTTYTIRRGDTLDAIARRHGVSRRELTKANSLSNANKLQVGQRLVIPAR